MKPGDLIFYEGTYKSGRSKPQKHDMVHVEVFIGGETGEQTIGARFQKGVVKVHDSYKFPSNLWELKAIHFKSIDAWLEGKHESYCCDHAWHSEALALMAAAGKRSIFNDSTEEDEDAGGMEEDEPTPPQSRPTSSQDEKVVNTEESSSTTTAASTGDALDNEVTTCIPCKSPRDVLIQEQAKEIDFLRKELAETKAKVVEGEGQAAVAVAAVASGEDKIAKGPKPSSTPSKVGNSNAQVTSSLSIYLSIYLSI